VKQAIEQSAGDLMIVGHLPFLGKLAALLVADNEETEIVAFRFGCVVCVERIEQRRFRMNLIVRTERPGFVENGWVGHELRFGDRTRINVALLDPRCVMTTLAQDDLPPRYLGRSLIIIRCKSATSVSSLVLACTP
jgi:hypothetical protein